ncbi:nuclear protein MDM1 isoform X2 [Hemicordylus capensis]|uniref:nuclear protein MDM1 isoform X2 n=1 Tax=Hemicordylus capensis TaxID=884348 RepID=UPI0023045850|nr:nuclear protein MDM1 isoform X2 [Hemicordylus capensis]
MPIQCKGLSEYRRNFKWRKSDQSTLCIPTREEKCRWAGLRSDELGISREPNFISKRRVPYYNTQVSKSFEWNGGNDLEEDTSSEVEVHQPVQPLELHTNHKKEDINQETIKTPDAPRLPEKMQSNSASSKSESALTLAETKKSPSKATVHENKILAPAKKDAGKIDSGLNKVLQRKAGMNVSRSSSFPRSSEYQRQFVWKIPQKLSPLLAADQFIHSASKSIPPFKSPVITHETEYERSFKASPPVKELKQRCFLDEKERPVPESVETSLGKMNEKKETFSKTMEKPSKQDKMEAEQKQHQKHKTLSPHRSLRKMKTEYRSKFLSPAQYLYNDGAWLRIGRNVRDQGSQNTLKTMWYVEVKELREKAKAYRQRIQGTHFSRDHLNQILSDNNRLWDMSSDSSTEEIVSNNIRALDLAGIPERQISAGPKTLLQPTFSEQFEQNNTEKLGMSDAPTVPVRRHLVWDASANAEQLESRPPELEEGEEKEHEQELEEDEAVKGSNDGTSTDKQQEGNVNPSADMADSSAVSSRSGGRLPTPHLRALGGAQRTHHDLTTPSAGGVVLVSPPKAKSLFSLQTGKGSPGKHALPHNKVSREDFKRKSNRVEGETLSMSSSPAAGLKTLDPLPLRKDQGSNLDTSGVRSPPVHSEQTPKDPSLPYWSSSRRIQGSLRDPEFQHNGNVASPKRSWLQLPLQERNYNDEDDDRLSQLSARSAASSSLASQVLERAQRRKENFWGKM